MSGFDPSKRELVTEPSIGAPVLMFVYVFIGVPGMAVIVLVVRDVLQALDERWPTLVYLVIGSAAWILFLVFVTSLWWRWYRYGRSICRLITLPGVAGGWFKADVDCPLPPGDLEPVVVRLINLKFVSQPFGGTKELWRMEQKLTVAPSKGRGIVPVGMQIPHDPRQLVTGQWGDEAAIWLLKIEKKARGVDFSAEFAVPITDIREGNPEEQRPG